MLYVYRSNRLERLADALADVIKDPLPSPLAQEWIGVQTQGMGVWLGMALSQRFGVWANGHHPFPRAVIETLFSSALEKEDAQRYGTDTSTLTWGILAILPNFLDQPEFSSLKQYLSGDTQGVKQYQLACRIARAFDQYAVYRPDMVLEWDAGQDDSATFKPEQRWQPVLWRALWKQLDKIHVASQFSQYLSVIQEGSAPLADLPSRLTFFGISTLPPLYVKALDALPVSVPVHLFILSPSHEFWADVRSRKEIEQAELKKTIQGKPDEAELYLEEGHPLLATLGRLGREFQAVLEESTRYVEPRNDLYEDLALSGRGDMLTVLQSDILNLRHRKKDTSLLPISIQDRSIEIHICHSPMREVQVLQDQLLAMLDEDVSLDLHDIIVMAPDIETYAPFIEAVFGAGTKASHVIPYRISDRSLAQDAAVIRAFMTLVRLVRSRFSIQEVIDFLSMEVVRDRFDLSEEEVGIGTQWLLDVGVRWGVDASHRVEVGQPDYEENTWRFGLDRLLIGMAMPEDHSMLFGSVLPYTQIEGKESETLGKISAFCHQLFDIRRQCQTPKTTEAWQHIFIQALSSLVVWRPETENQHQLIHHACQTLFTDSRQAGFEEELPLTVIEQWFSDWLKQRSSTSGFLSGGVTFCNLLPMRSIPFRIVYLMGMNDLDFPRRQPSMGFDLTEMSPRRGDRSVRQDDLYLFLEALLSARSRFLISYIGRDIKDNSPKPPSVVVDALIDTLCDGFVPGADSGNDKGAADLRDHLITRHPIHPFHVDYFSSDHRRLFSFSEAYLAGAAAGAGEKIQPSAFMSTPLPGLEATDSVVRIQDLVRFYKMPARFFLQHRLGISLQEETVGLNAREPLLLDGIVRYEVGEFLLNEMLAGKSPRELYDILRAAGKLPFGKAGRFFYDAMLDTLMPIVDEVSPRMIEDKLPPLSVDIDIGGIRIFGAIGSRWPRARCIVTAGTLSVNRKLSFWIEHLLLSSVIEKEAAGPSLLAGRDRDRVEVIEFPPVPDSALALLSDLVLLFLKGQTEPLRFFPNASHAFAAAWHQSTGPDQAARAWRAARKDWRGNDRGFPGDAADLSVQRVFDTGDPLSDGSEDPELSFERLSLRIFSPMLTTAMKADTKGRS